MSKTPKKPAAKEPAPKPTPPKAKTSKDRGLGRGLSALMSDIGALSGAEPVDSAKAETEAEAEAPTQAPSQTQPSTKPKASEYSTEGRGISMLAIDQIVRNPDQPRRYFDPALLGELTQSIKDKGVLQPILVRPIPDSVKTTGQGLSKTKPIYQIVAGERRWQASLKAGLTMMPALIRPLSDQEVLEVGVIENVQRADLNPLEEAQAYSALIEQFGRTQNDISIAIGKSRSHIANMLRLLTLPKRAQEALKTGEISTGHARAIVAAPDPDALVEQIISQNLSVRDAEDRVRHLKKLASDGADGFAASAKAQPTEKTPDIRALEAELRDALGLIVDLRHKGPAGELRIKYRSDAQLEAVLKRLRR